MCEPVEKPISPALNAARQAKSTMPIFLGPWSYYICCDQ